MKKFIEVKEFDTIICKEECSGNYKYLEKEYFDDLENFIKEFTGSEEVSDAFGFMRLGYHKKVGRTITLNNYVGLIQTNRGLQVQVLPKIDFKDGEKDNTMKIFLHMLRSMKDFQYKVFHISDLKIDHMNLYEIFINMYIQETWNLVKHGIKSDYIMQQDNLTYFKGKLLIKEQIKQNITHKERFYDAYDEFEVDRPENRIVKATLLKLQKFSENGNNAKQLRQLLVSFESVAPSINYDKDFEKVVINRTTKDYEMLMKWSKVFLQNKSFSSFSGNTSSRTLLFPMESVFEVYVARELKKVLVSDWKISVQDRGLFLFDKPKKFSLRPDIIITKPDGTQIIVDTKWKRLIDNPNKNYGISQSDMYQMFAYAIKYNTPHVWLLYPITKELRDQYDITYESSGEHGVEVKIRIFFVDVVNIKESLIKLQSFLAR